MSRLPGLIPRSAPVAAPEKPKLFKMPTTLAASRVESDRANIGPTKTMNNPSHQGYSQQYPKSKADLEKYDSGLDEITQRWPTITDLTPVACTDEVSGQQHGYLLHNKEPRAPSVSQPLVESKMEISMDISVDSAIEPSANSNSIQSSSVNVSGPTAKSESKLLQTVQSLFVEDDDGESMLHLSVIFESRPAVRQILTVVSRLPMLRGCLNDQNKMKQTALHLAANLNLPGIVEDLLFAGADADLQDINGNTPFHIVCKKGHLQCMDIFLSNTTSEKLRKIAQLTNNEGYNALHLAVMQSHVKAIRRLNDIGCSMDVQDKKSGLRPVHHALRRPDALRVVKCLVEDCDADVNASTYTGCTALHMAASQGHIDQVAYLIALGADPLCRTDEGDLPIDYAADSMVADLLERVICETTRTC